MNDISEKSLRRSKTMYIFEAALEYLISILVSGSFLAVLTKELGFSDGLTGVLSSVISLGCLFQLLSLCVRRTSVKRMVVTFSIINQILFMLLYVIPLTSLGGQAKTAIFAVLIVLAYLIYNTAHPKKTNWLMSLVEDDHRGGFTATKEIVSLVSGMIFSFAMGAVIDMLSDKGEIQTAFAVSVGVMLALTVLHTLTMLFSVEPRTVISTKKDLKSSVLELAKDKNVIHIAVVFCLYYISTYISTPFYGTYQINELGLNLKFISIITVSGSISRILITKFWGNYADKKSFAAMIEKCFVFLALAQLCVVFAAPSTGKAAFVLYYILHGAAMGGINSALTNLVFEYSPKEKTADALAVTQAIAGSVGFITTLCVSPIISYFQDNALTVFGFRIFAQQIASLAAVAVTVLAIIYTRRVFIKNK